MYKRGQQTVGLPFGIIFAVFLIVIFLVVAIIAAMNFLDLGESYSVGIFYDDLQGEVNLAWRSQSYDSEFEIKLPSGIKTVCFANLSKPVTDIDGSYQEIKNFDIYDANTFLIPPEKASGIPYYSLSHINISKITTSENPYCVSTDGSLNILKGFNEGSVVIK